MGGRGARVLAAAIAAAISIPVAAAEAAPLPLPVPVDVELAPPSLTLKCGTTVNDPPRTQNFPPFVGSSDLNAETANGSLAAGLTREGTITVLRWPTPSSYDQVKHFSPDANLPRAGARANEGIYLGVVIAGRTHWLRDWRERQRYVVPESDEIETVYRNDELGVRVSVRSVAAADADVLSQRVEVKTLPGAPARPTALVAFENLNLVVSNIPSAFLQDWCLEELNTDRASWAADAGALVHEKTGTDLSTGKPQSVAIALGFGRQASGHQVGGDALEPAAAPGAGQGPAIDASLDAADGALSGNDSYEGQTTGAVTVPLRYRRGVATEDFHIAAAHDRAGATALLTRARARGQKTTAKTKRAALARRLRNAPMPKTNDKRMLAIARRSLILLLTNTADTGAIVASITTQPPYAEDWPRDGSFFTEALEVAGLHDLAERHELFYTRTQATETFQPPGAVALPPGNWGMNYYENGTVAGPIPFEIDETGFAAWGLWRHYEHTKDRAYLERVYPTIARAANFLVACRDPLSGLQCPAFEDDDPTPAKQTITGASTVRLGLHAAEQAARELGNSSDAERWSARRAELEKAIDDRLWSERCGCYGADITFSKFLAYSLWPVPLHDLGDARMARHAEHLWGLIAPSFSAPRSDRTWHAYEAMSLLALARIYRGQSPEKLRRLRTGLRWIAHEQATPDTVILGENWRVHDGKVQTMTARPQIWEHVLFYLASIEVYGRKG